MCHNITIRTQTNSEEEKWSNKTFMVSLSSLDPSVIINNSLIVVTIVDGKYTSNGHVFIKNNV